jgi:bifunctional non-homologous end joining protein LigD
MSLETYRQKRNFDRTAEPRGRQSRRTGHSFVVQKHDARNLHYDFRLELGGVLLSWAVPKGPSLDPGVKRLAMQTEDHPLEYGDFEGVIPEGEYGGGAVLLWDRGTWEPEGDAEEMYRRGRLNFALHGQKLHGSFHLVRTAPAGKSNKPRWLLFKSKDDAAQPGTDDRILVEKPESVETGRDIASVAKDPDHVWTSKDVSKRRSATPREPRAKANAAGAALDALGERRGVKRARLPEFVEPELATLSAEAPAGSDWLHEIKLDGYRILARIERGRAQLLSRRANDWTSRLPSIASALGSLPLESGLLDGEVVVLGDDGVSDFQRLQNSMEAGRDVGCVYFAFDALFLNGFDLRGLPLAERKLLLKDALGQLDNPRVRLGDHVVGDGPAFFARACQHGLEGIVCKRADSRYTSGRGRSWLKVKCLSRQEFVIGGFTEPAGSRRHLGALLIGVRDPNGELTYAGKVGTGFTQASLAELAERLAPLVQTEPPFKNPPSGAERRGVHWVRPSLVAEIAFVERTEEGLVRHSSFQGLREDKRPEEVQLETAEETPRKGRGAKGSGGRGVEGSRARVTTRAGATKVTSAKKKAASSEKKPRTEKKAVSSEKNPRAEKKAVSSKKPRAEKKASAKKGAPSGASRAAASAKPRVAATKTVEKRAAPRQVVSSAPIELDPSRLEITHPDRILYPDQGITKRDLMLHYARVARWMLPQVALRPLMLVRCPEGANAQCFHQKHPSRGMPKAVQTVTVQQQKGPESNLMIRDIEGLLGLIQMGALEIHAWGCREAHLDCPDQLVFDLDPDEGLPWPRVIEAAHTLRDRLVDLGLTGFPRLTGGKGLHVVVPVEPTTKWSAAKTFTQRVAEAMVEAEPAKYVATMAKAKRKGKIFIDYLRNGAGATAVCSYSTRARTGAPLAVPIEWSELGPKLSSDRFTVQNFEKRLQGYRDPWASFDEARAPIPT